MGSSLFLQIFIYISVFLIGVAATLATQHGYAHFKQKPDKSPRPKPQGGHLPPEVRERILHASEEHFEDVLEHTATELQHDLETTAAQLSRSLDKLGTTVVATEMERYQEVLARVRQQASAAMDGANKEIAAHQAELLAKIEETVDAEKQRQVQSILAEKQQIMQQIDTKLADAVASFLMESLQHNVDLGAQAAYITAMLEEHKADFKREVSSEAQAAK